MTRTRTQKARTVQVVKTYKTKGDTFDLIGPEIRDPGAVAAITEDARIVRVHDWYAPFTHLVRLGDGREALVEIA